MGCNSWDGFTDSNLSDSFTGNYQSDSFTGNYQELLLMTGGVYPIRPREKSTLKQMSTNDSCSYGTDYSYMLFSEMCSFSELLNDRCGSTDQIVGNTTLEVRNLKNDSVSLQLSKNRCPKII